MQAIAAKPIVDNLNHPEIAPHFQVKSREERAGEAMKKLGRVLMHTFLPMFIGEYQAYVDHRGSQYQTKLATKSLRTAIIAYLIVSFAWLLIIRSILPYIWPRLFVFYGTDFARFYLGSWWEMLFGAIVVCLRFSILHSSSFQFVDLSSYWNLVLWWVLFNVPLNIYCGKRFSKPNWRALDVKRRPDVKNRIIKQLSGSADTKQQVSAIAKNNWKVDFFNCDAQIADAEFPDDSAFASVIGTDGRSWIKLSFGGDTHEKHYSIFGDKNFGKQKFFMALIKAALGDKKTAIVMADAEESTGVSFTQYEKLSNVAVASGLLKSRYAIEAVWKELRRRIAERVMSKSNAWSRLVLAVDDTIAAGTYGFWKKSIHDGQSNDLKVISRLMKEIIASGKMHNIHVIAVLGNTKFDWYAFNAMRPDFESFAFFFQTTIKSKKGSGEVISEQVQTHEFPYFGMLSMLLRGQKLMMKSRYLKEKDFISYCQSCAIHLDIRMKMFLDDIRSARNGKETNLSEKIEYAGQ